jgi:hypothetical protein
MNSVFHRQRVQSILDEMPPAFEGDEWIILDNCTIERDWGWVFFYDSRLYWETRDDKYLIAGNAPFLVRRSDGAMLPTCTAYSIEKQIKEYQERGELP